MIRVLVDGVFFQMTNTGIARVWAAILALLARDPRFELFLLDRGDAPSIEGISSIPFPSYRFQYCVADSEMIQNLCDLHQIDVFTSSYYTTPMRTPMVLLVYDMIPELFGFDMSVRGWLEKTVAIAYAQHYVCISKNTCRDLVAIHPEIPMKATDVAYCGVDRAVFRERKSTDVAAFRGAYGLDRPYFLFVGSRVQYNGYKNSQLFFDALSRIEDPSFDVFCAGGEVEIEADILRNLPPGMRCQRVHLTDDELNLAYAGAQALVYPSLYEGFGMPVIEAMASACPVITTAHGSLAEAAGDAAIMISGVSVQEMADALAKVQQDGVAEALRAKGLVQASRFQWEGIASVLADCFVDLTGRARSGEFDAYVKEWQRIRRIQGAVDYA